MAFADARALATPHANVMDASDDLAHPGVVGWLAAADKLEGACSIRIGLLEKWEQPIGIDQAQGTRKAR
jgi:hypothetical protein